MIIQAQRHTDHVRAEIETFNLRAKYLHFGCHWRWLVETESAKYPVDRVRCSSGGHLAVELLATVAGYVCLPMWRNSSVELGLLIGPGAIRQWQSLIINEVLMRSLISGATEPCVFAFLYGEWPYTVRLTATPIAELCKAINSELIT